jgi:retron-type reverse transcriptase
MKYNEEKMVTRFFKEHEINIADIKAEKLNVIENIHKIMYNYANNSDSNIRPVFNNLMNIINNEKILIIAYNNIKSNSGADTKSVDEITADSVSIKKIREISFDLTKGTFKFGNIRQIYVPKPGKGITKWTKDKLIKYGRPLGIPNFKDKIVQEAIRIVLTAIYEPLFDKTNSFGFRPNCSALDTMILIESQAQGMDLALEGDISKAFDTMNHDILKKELSIYITDQKFLNLIIECCRSGIFNSLTNSYEFPCIGTPQEAIVSPILWNIYMYKLDRYIGDDINKLIEILNKKQLIKKVNPKDKRTKNLYRYSTTNPTKSNEYKVFSTKLSKINNEILAITNRTPVSRLPIKVQKILIPLIRKKQLLEKTLFKTSSINLSRIKLRLLYIRYADDFIILTNSNLSIMKYIKNKIHSFLKYELKLKLSLEKTFITDLKKKAATFLGFTLYKIKAQRLRYLDSDPKIKKRTTGGKISIGVDYERIIKKFKEKKYLDDKRKICSIGKLTKKEDIEILLRFNEIIIGFAIYYLPVITRTHYLNYILYILEYSFYKTLCHKNKTTINKIRKQHNNMVGFTRDNLTNPENSKYYYIISNRNIKEQIGSTIEKIRNNLFNKLEQRTIIKNIMMEYRKGFWRTNASMSSACIYCGSWEDIEYHHIKKLGSDRKKYKYAFDYNIRALNRKAIPLCAECHDNVHRGQLDTMELKDLYDKRLVQY